MSPQREAVDEYRKMISKRVTELNRLKLFFEKEMHAETDEFKQAIYQNQMAFAETLIDIYDKITIDFTITAVNKAKIDLIMDALLEIPNIKNNPEVTDRLNNLSKEFDNLI